MVLYHYTGMEEVCFGYDEFDMAGSARKPGPMAIKHRVNLETQLGKFLQGKEGKEGRSLRDKTGEENVKLQLQYNTAMMLQVRNTSDNSFSPTAFASQHAAMSLPDEVSVCTLISKSNGIDQVVVQNTDTGQVCKRGVQCLFGIQIPGHIGCFCFNCCRNILADATWSSRRKRMHYSGNE